MALGLGQYAMVVWDSEQVCRNVASLSSALKLKFSSGYAIDGVIVNPTHFSRLNLFCGLVKEPRLASIPTDAAH